ncbi:MAG: InlB B-repeat-containing protein [Treponema sp.]
MTKTMKLSGQGGSVRKIRKKLLLLGLTLAALLAFSCSQEEPASVSGSDGEKTFDIAYKLDGGANNPDNPKTYSANTLPIKLKAPSKTGFTFDGWYTDKDFKNKIEKIQKGATGTLTLYAKWSALPSVSYKVIHFRQPVTGDTYVKHEEETLNGKEGEDTGAAAKDYPNFHLSEGLHPGKKIVQRKIKKDGSTEVEIYYDRDIFTAKFVTGGGNEIADKSGRYEAPLLKPTDPTKAGSTFIGWEPELPATFTANTTHTAKWTAEVLPQYTVEHWQQQVDSTGKVYDESAHNTPNYALKDTDTKNGKKDTQTQATAKVYSGFDLPTVTQENIKEDGTTVVKIYYVRKTVMLTFDAKGGKIDGQPTKILNGKYGEKLSVAEPVQDNGDKFSAWEPAVPQTFPEENKTYAAKWTALNSIEVITPPTTKDYIVGADFNPAGMVVKAKYDDGSNPTLTYGTDYTTDFNAIKNTVGDNQTVTVKHVKNPTKTATFTVNIKSAPSTTYAVGDIIDGTDGTTYKASEFPPAGYMPNTWEKYYVIVKVSGTSYVGVRYFDNTGYGDVELGQNINNTYNQHSQPASPNRYLNKDETAALFAHKETFKSSMKKIKKTGVTPTAENFEKKNCIYKGQDAYGIDAFFNGNDEEVTTSSPKNRDILPIIARDFN